MPPSRTSESRNVVLFTYGRRKVACARPATYEDALTIAKKTFGALNAIPAGRICITARLPDHEQAGFVEIAPGAWKLATNSVNQFAIGILNEEEMVQEAEEVKTENVQERVMPPFTPPPPKRSKAPRTSGAFRCE